MFSFSMPELVLILVIALVVFGPGKLPEVGKALGRGIQEFKKATTGEIKQEESKTEEKK
ncbi:twin-arginine translocase TatA/TatE family subunit [Pelosinus propionicus]|uniref:Sec-independent protein translocase protein TatA n=1 Tax=Pelosinus propionicus DSM 13327 TaxID=1123291 RepID=A0A1I4JJZ2_9FIRM|nr:twin-arginine translocase TatA/TatE family subunit [Pelosinus propionicus]SFL66426.1 sec-independent protein translocase protein TatA [Pelosinus propionicus DSM 13327]